jgi:hypothetical protein
MVRVAAGGRGDGRHKVSRLTLPPEALAQPGRRGIGVAAGGQEVTVVTR